MEWNKDIQAIPFGEEVLLKVKFRSVPYYIFHLVEKLGRIGEVDRFVLTDEQEDLTWDCEIVAWLELDENFE